MARVRVTDPIAQEGLDLLAEAGHHVVAASDDAEAWVIRSGTQITDEAMAGCPSLKAIARAGVGVDNIEVPSATARGIAVFHAPTGNITSAAEQAWALLLAAARRIPEADAAMKGARWARKELQGVELCGKTIFIVGLGRIGRMMAARAQAFEMTCLGYDPFVSPEAAASFGVESVSLEEGFSRANFATLHTPLTPQTAGLVGAELLARVQPGFILVNAARGGLVDETALLEALERGNVLRAGIDVWEQEPPTEWDLAKHPRVVAAPHLGASTKEAQTKATTQAVGRLVDFLESGDASLAINSQATVPEALAPWAQLAGDMAAFLAQTVTGTVQEIRISASSGMDPGALEVPALCGAMRAVVGNDVNAINAPGLAKQRGIRIASAKLAEDDPFIQITIQAEGTHVIEGVWTPHYGGRVTSLGGFDIEFRPQGRFILTQHQDVPGVLAAITGALAEANVNVAHVSLARRAPEGEAMAVIGVDGSIPKPARDALRALKTIREAHRIRV